MSVPLRPLLAVLAALLGAALAPVAAPAAEPAPAAPSCAEGPERVGTEILGTPCADRIVVPATVARVDGGGGDDTILAAPILAAAQECSGGCFGGIGSQTIEGGAGNDLIFGQRGNDTLRGGPGNDRLYGGIGDDKLEGGEGDDFLYGGFGGDAIDGQGGSDLVRGDGTIDKPLRDTGVGGTDTLSYASGTTPGFGGGIDTGATGFPGGAAGERGVFLQLGVGGLNGNNGAAETGGGVDEVTVGGFERIVGTAFSDYIVGSSADETIYGGGGADAIKGEGGNDSLHGGADGDDLDGGTGANSADGGPGADACQNAPGAISCTETATHEVATRNSAQVSLGLMVPSAETGPTAQVYLVGSSGKDTITATYAGAEASFVISGASFDAESSLNGCSVQTSTTATCPLSAPLGADSLLIAGMGGDDAIAANGFPPTVSVVETGGEGADTLSGGDASEDVLVDGLGDSGDTLSALGGDDALLHDDGADTLRGGSGNDLFISFSICDNEHLVGEAGVDNSSWTKLEPRAVAARLDQGIAGEVGANNSVTCASGGADTMSEIEDLEGSNQDDTLVGDADPNQILGHQGADSYFALAGNDSILANAGSSDRVIDCGEGAGDSAVIDIPNPPKVLDPTPVNCEKVRQGAPNEFETITELPPVVEPTARPRDRKPPQGKITKRPPRILNIGGRRKKVVFRFTSTERGSHFRCKLDRKPFRACHSPRAYTVGLGAHSVSIVAIDAAGNADRTPAKFSFRVRRR